MDMGKVCLKVVLFFIIRDSRDSGRLENGSKYLMKAVFTVKYITNFEFTPWHVASDSKRKWFSASRPQLHNTLLFYQNIWMTGCLNGYIIVNVAYNVLIIRPIC